MLARPVIYDGRQQRDAQLGDIVTNGRRVASNAAGAATTLLATDLTAGILDRTGPGAGFNDTMPSAENLRAALAGLGNAPVQGDGFTWIYRNGVAFAMTAVAGVGTSIANASVAASVVRYFQVTCLNGQPAVSYVGTTVNTDPKISGFTAAQLANVIPGMEIVSTTGVTAGTTVIGVNPNTGIVTMSANATASGTVAVNFSPRFEVRGLGVMTA
jgi:hypothetical protein